MPTTDLTVDHLIPVIDGGAGGPLRVLCRSCNSRRGSKTLAG
jgi:5-methylcytosine-specific restriction endonuclease McrA